MAFGWLKKAVRSAGKVAKGAVKVAVAPVKLAAKAGRTVGKALGKVPVVGGGLKGVFDLTLNAPFQVAGQVANGTRLDRVALNAVRAHVQQVKAVAPYAQTVISVVPAVGPGVNAAIGAGLSLASGQPISTAIMEGAKSALPGGPLAKQLFSAGQAVVEGKPLSGIVLSTLPLDATAKRGLGMALDVTQRLAKGQRVDKALLAQADDAMKLLPIDARKGLQVGIALAEGKRLQQIASKHVNISALSKLKQGGINIIKASPVLASADKILKTPAARAGYAAGVGMLAVKNPPPFQVAAVRNAMNQSQRAGFDMAVAARSGMVTTRLAAPRSYSPAQQLGFYTIRGVSPALKSAPPMIKAVRANPATKVGASLAIAQIQDTKPNLWGKIKIYLFGE